VAVALTTVGMQLASETGGIRPLVLIDMLDYGIVLDSQSNGSTFSLTSTDPPIFPAGATASCGQAVFVNSDTTCPFAQNVEQAYSNSNSPGTGTTTVTVASPVTGQTYTMQCTGQWPVVCQGGTNALVEFYILFS
jgi:serine/threonine-protein kinase